MISLGKVVAAKPIEFQQARAKVSSGFAMTEQKVSLTSLEVVIASDDGKFKISDMVYVRADSYVKPWAKTIYKVNDIEFILVPAEEILLLEGVKPSRPDPLPPSSGGENRLQGGMG